MKQQYKKLTDEEIEDHIGFKQISNSLKDVKENTEVIELANWQKLKKNSLIGKKYSK